MNATVKNNINAPALSTQSSSQASEQGFQLASAQLASAQVSNVQVSSGALVAQKPATGLQPKAPVLKAYTARKGDISVKAVPNKPDAKGMVTWTVIVTQRGKTEITYLKAPQNWQYGAKPLPPQAAPPAFAGEEQNPLIQALMGASVDFSAGTLGIAGRLLRKTGIPIVKDAGQGLINAHKAVEDSALNGSSIGGIVINGRMNPNGRAAKIGGGLGTAATFLTGGGGVALVGKGLTKLPAIAKVVTWAAPTVIKTLSKPAVMKTGVVIAGGLTVGQIGDDIQRKDLKGLTRDLALLGAGGLGAGRALTKPQLNIAANKTNGEIFNAIQNHDTAGMKAGIAKLKKLAANAGKYPDLRKNIKTLIERHTLALERGSFEVKPTGMAGRRKPTEITKDVLAAAHFPNWALLSFNIIKKYLALHPHLTLKTLLGEIRTVQGLLLMGNMKERACSSILKNAVRDKSSLMEAANVYMKGLNFNTVKALGASDWFAGNPKAIKAYMDMHPQLTLEQMVQESKDVDTLLRSLKMNKSAGKSIFVNALESKKSLMDVAQAYVKTLNPHTLRAAGMSDWAASEVSDIRAYMAIHRDLSLKQVVNETKAMEVFLTQHNFTNHFVGKDILKKALHDKSSLKVATEAYSKMVTHQTLHAAGAPKWVSNFLLTESKIMAKRLETYAGVHGLSLEQVVHELKELDHAAQALGSPMTYKVAEQIMSVAQSEQATLSKAFDAVFKTTDVKSLLALRVPLWGSYPPYMRAYVKHQNISVIEAKKQMEHLEHYTKMVDFKHYENQGNEIAKEDIHNILTKVLQHANEKGINLMKAFKETVEK